jgi:hypothetical protein
MLSVALVSALLPARITRARQRVDSDGDGLFDDDETTIYGTRPDVADTDGDGFNDGYEICNRDRIDPNCQQDLIHTNPLDNEDAAAPPPPPACTAVGGPCAAHSNCCGYDTPNVLCCFDANGAGVCTDVSVRSFTCPDPGVPATGCAVGMTNCGGFCTDLSVDHGNCGACGNRCSQVCGPDCNCVTGTCTKVCNGAYCGDVCIDTQNDPNNCGACGYRCGMHPDNGGQLGCTYGVCNLPF